MSAPRTTCDECGEQLDYWHAYDLCDFCRYAFGELDLDEDEGDEDEGDE